MIKTLEDTEKRFSNGFSEDPVGKQTAKITEFAVSTYQSIRFDLQKTIDVEQDNFDHLFPLLKLDLDNYSMLKSSVMCMIIQLEDMIVYTKRLR